MDHISNLEVNEQKWRDYVVPDKSLLREGNRKWRTNSLFLEFYRELDGYQPLFTLGEEDRRGCISLRKVYLANEDPTEYYFAQKVFGSWDYWQALRKSVLLRNELPKWRTELETRLKSKAFLKIIETADGDSKFAYDANKLLVKEGWKEPEGIQAKRGRPSKEEVEGELSKQSALEKKILEDAKKMGLVVSMDEKKQEAANG